MATGRPATARLVCRTPAALGESPLWLAERSELIWVDVPTGLLHRYSPRRGPRQPASLPAPLTAVAARTRGGLVAVAGGRVYLLDDRLRVVTTLADLELDALVTRSNDSVCDPAGRLLVGSMALDAATTRGELLRIDAAGQKETLRAGLVVSNGMGWSPDGAFLYHVDTGAAVIYRYDADPTSGELGPSHRWLTVPDGLGRPDGLAVDLDGGVWVAMWGSGAVNRYAADGALDSVLTVGAPYVTSCAFGGDDLKQLFVTTARGGGVHQAHVEVGGVPTHSFAG